LSKESIRAKTLSRSEEEKKERLEANVLSAWMLALPALPYEYCKV
jgi:hypothetical protein